MRIPRHQNPATFIAGAHAPTPRLLVYRLQYAPIIRQIPGTMFERGTNKKAQFLRLANEMSALTYEWECFSDLSLSSNSFMSLFCRRPSQKHKHSAARPSQISRFINGDPNYHPLYTHPTYNSINYGSALLNRSENCFFGGA
jgi:hypothetical protein